MNVACRRRVVIWTRRSRKACRKAIKSQWFYWLVIILVFFNTCVLCTEYYGQPYWLDVFQGTQTFLRLGTKNGANFGFFCRIYFRGHFEEIGILREPRYVESFGMLHIRRLRKCSEKKKEMSPRSRYAIAGDHNYLFRLISICFRSDNR